MDLWRIKGAKLNSAKSGFDVGTDTDRRKTKLNCCCDFPNSRQRDAIIRIAAALMKEPEAPSATNGDRVAAALERIADWCDASSEIWDKMTEGE